MSGQAWFMLVLFMITLVALALPLSKAIARIAQPEPIIGWAGSAERLLYRWAGIKQSSEMPGTRDAIPLPLV